MPLNLNIPSPVLPYGSLTDAQKLSSIENKQELDLRNKELQERKEQQYSLRNLQNLNEDVTKIKTPLGNEYANNIMNTEASKVYQDLISKVSQYDPVTFDYLLHQQTDNLFNWEKQFKTDLDFTQKYADDLLKNNTNLDPNKTKLVAQQGLESKYFEQNPNGEWVRKHPDNIINNQNPVAALDDPKMQGLLAIGGLDVLKKYIQTAPLQKADFSEYSSKRGFVNSNSYDIGYNPALKELTHDEHGNPMLKMKTEDFSLGNGLNLRMLPADTYNEYMSKPEVASAINKLWLPQSQAIEANAAKQGMEIDPHTEEMLKRDFVRKVIEDNGVDLSFIQKKEKQIIPKPPHISINVGGQQTPVFNPQTSGTELDRVGNVKPLHFNNSNVTISQGLVTDKNGQPYTGENLTLRNEDLPAGLLSVLKSSGIDFKDEEYWNIKVDNGRIEAIKPTDGNWIDRQDIFNYQLKTNTEPVKSTQPNFGNPNLGKPKASSGKKVIPNF